MLASSIHLPTSAVNSYPSKELIFLKECLFFLVNKLHPSESLRALPTPPLQTYWTCTWKTGYLSLSLLSSFPPLSSLSSLINLLLSLKIPLISPGSADGLDTVQVHAIFNDFSFYFPLFLLDACVYFYISFIARDGREAFQVDILYFWGRSRSICPFISSLYVLNLGKILGCYSLKCFRFQCSENRVRVSFPRRCLRADGHQSVSLTHGSALLPQLRCYLCSEFSSIPGPREQLCCLCSCETSFMFSL